MSVSRGLGKRVKEFRLDKLMTQRQLGVAMGVSHITIVRIERGDKISDLTRAKIEKFFKSQGIPVAA